MVQAEMSWACLPDKSSLLPGLEQDPALCIVCISCSLNYGCLHVPSVRAAECVKAPAGKPRSSQVSLVLVSGGVRGCSGAGQGVLPCCSAPLGRVVGQCSFTGAG